MTDTRSIAALLLKTTGLVLIVYVISAFPAYLPLTAPSIGFSLAEALGAMAMALGPLAVLGILFWFFPGTLSNKIVGAGAEPATPGLRPVLMVGVAIVGVYFTAHGLVDAVRDGAFFVIVKHQNGNFDAAPASVIAHAIAALAQVVIGILLTFGARGVAHLVHSLRDR